MDSNERIRQLRDEYDSALDEAERVRQRYHREIMKLHRSGASLREIAEGLGMSHQRVHQIVSPQADRPRSRKKRTVIAGAISTLLILLLGGVFVVRDLTMPDRPTLRVAPSLGVGTGTPPAITFGCRISSRSESAFTTITIAAECQRRIEELLRGKRDDVGLVALDPRTGRIIAIVSGGSRPAQLQNLLAAA